MDESSTAASEVDAATAAGRYAMSDLFEKYLSSGEGELSMMEALGAMAELVGPTSREFIARFGEVDVDKSGTLSREEFEALYVKMLAQPDVVEAAYTAAALPPPAVSASPPPPLLPSESISALFAKYDTSGDGVLQVRLWRWNRTAARRRRHRHRHSALSLCVCVCVCAFVCVWLCASVCVCLSLAHRHRVCQHVTPCVVLCLHRSKRRCGRWRSSWGPTPNRSPTSSARCAISMARTQPLSTT